MCIGACVLARCRCGSHRQLVKSGNDDLRQVGGCVLAPVSGMQYGSWPKSDHAARAMAFQFPQFFTPFPQPSHIPLLHPRPHQDAVMQQTFALINGLLARDAAASRRRLRIATYRVVPFTPVAGVC